MKVAIIFPKSPFNIGLPHLLKILSEGYENAIKTKIKEKKEKFQIEDLRTSPSWGFRVLPSIAYLSSILKLEGIKPLLLHMDYLRSKVRKEKNLLRIIEKKVSRYDAAILFNSTVQFNEVIRLAKTIKSFDSECLTISCGREATFLTRMVLKDGFDIAIRGECEEIIPDLLKKVSKKGVGYLIKDKNIRGIGIKHNKKIVVKDGVNKVNVNSLPPPDFKIFPHDLRKNANISWWVSRGCPFKCEYCYEHFFWNPLRIKTIEKIKLELEKYKKYFPFNHIFFHDSTFNALKDWRAILQLINKEFDLYNSLNLRADLLSNYDLKFLKSSRTIAVFSGIETFSNQILFALKRFQKINTMLKKVKKLNKIIPFLTLSTIIGLPGENIDNVQNLKKIISALLLKDKIFQVTTRVFVPYPGTPIFHHPKKYGIEILTYNFERYDRYSFPPVYRLKNLNEFEIYSLFLDVYSLIVKLNLESVNYPIRRWEDELFEEINEESKNIYKVKYG